MDVRVIAMRTRHPMKIEGDAPIWNAPTSTDAGRSEG